MAPDIRRTLLTGTVTAIPILVTIFIFSFFMSLLSGIGRPKVIVLANAVKPLSPDCMCRLLEVPWLSSTLAIALTLGMLYLSGWSMHRLVGRQVIRSVEEWLGRIPLVTTVYGSTKKLVEAFQADSGRAQRWSLIEFPHSRMKAVGLVTRTFIDEETGEALAAVYVPTAPNPTGGYLEIVPVGELVTLDWDGGRGHDLCHFRRHHGSGSDSVQQLPVRCAARRVPPGCGRQRVRRTPRRGS